MYGASNPFQCKSNGSAPPLRMQWNAKEISFIFCCFLHFPLFHLQLVTVLTTLHIGLSAVNQLTHLGKRHPACKYLHVLLSVSCWSYVVISLFQSVIYRDESEQTLQLFQHKHARTATSTRIKCNISSVLIHCCFCHCLLCTLCSECVVLHWSKSNLQALYLQ